MRDNGVQIAVICEDQAHRALATFLADRVLRQAAEQRSADWIDDETLPSLRRYCGRYDTEDTPEHLRFYSLAQAHRDVEDLGKHLNINGKRIKLRGHIDGEPLKPEASFWRRVLLLFVGLEPRPDALIIVHDTDGDLGRIGALERARRLVPGGVPLIVATPHRDAEGWFVAGFVPQTEVERARLRDRKAALGFSPPDEPHRLTAHPNHALTDAKRVLRILVFDDNTSRPPTLAELPDLCERTLSDLARLEQRKECQIAAFIQELRTILVPLLIPGPALAP